MSGAPMRIGTNQFPKPPISIGITMKKIIKMACAVTTTLYAWWLPRKNWFPGYASSKRINKDNIAPMRPERVPKIKYSVPISLWLVEKNHLVKNRCIFTNIFKMNELGRSRTYNGTIMSGIFYHWITSSKFRTTLLTKLF